VVDRKGLPVPELRGISIQNFATICNAVSRHGTSKVGYAATEHGTVTEYRWDALGIPLLFKSTSDHMYNGYRIRYSLSGNDWRIECFGGMFPPQPHTNLWDAPYDKVHMNHIRNNPKERHIFGFNLYRDEESYLHDMAILRLMLPMWEMADDHHK